MSDLAERGLGTEYGSGPKRLLGTDSRVCPTDRRPRSKPTKPPADMKSIPTMKSFEESTRGGRRGKGPSGPSTVADAMVGDPTGVSRPGRSNHHNT